MDKRLAKELIKSRQAVKEKYHMLKSAASTTQAELEQTYKPITQPIQELVSAIGKSEHLHIKEEPVDLQEEYFKTSTPTKVKITPKTGKTPILPPETPSFFNRSTESISQIPNIQETSIIAETFPSQFNHSESRNLSDILEETRQTIQTYVGSSGYDDWLNAFHELPRTYIDEGVRDTKSKFDHNYGIVHDLERDKFFLGLTQKPVEIIGKNIHVEGIKYPGTVGLYELLFKKEPVGYKNEDLENYMDILKRTNAYRRNFDPNEQVQGNSSHKYVTIIGPYLQRKGITKTKTITPLERLTEAFAKPKAPFRTSRTTAVQKGKGLTLKINKSNTDYVYWDNINELVDRLRLLLASTDAGNTAHNNEILSIIEELREAKVIL